MGCNYIECQEKEKWYIMNRIKGMRALNGLSKKLAGKTLLKRRNLRKKIDDQKTTGGVIWLEFFKKKLNTRETQTVAVCDENFVVPDINGQEPQFLMPHHCLQPSIEPLFTTRHYGDIYIVKV